MDSSSELVFQNYGETGQNKNIFNDFTYGQRKIITVWLFMVKNGLLIWELTVFFTTMTSSYGPLVKPL